MVTSFGNEPFLARNTHSYTGSPPEFQLTLALTQQTRAGDEVVTHSPASRSLVAALFTVVLGLLPLMLQTRATETEESGRKNRQVLDRAAGLSEPPRFSTSLDIATGFSAIEGGLGGTKLSLKSRSRLKDCLSPCR